MPDHPDAVFHVAADTSMWCLKNKQQTHINVQGTKNLIQTALKKQAGRFIHTSSISEFGSHKVIIDESTQSNAMHSKSNYVRTKWLAAREVEQAGENGLDAVILNPCQIIGPYDTHNWGRLFTLVQENRLPGIPPGIGTFCHARAVAEAHLAAFEHGRQGEHYILGGIEASFHDVIQRIGHILQKPTPQRGTPLWLLKTMGWTSQWLSFLTRTEPNLTPEKVRKISDVVRCNTEKACTQLGYRIVPLNTMLSDYHRWMQSQ